jgi:hypothetical protein
MKYRLMFSSLLLALAPTALASSIWYVNGVVGSDANGCKSPTTACKTIGHAISLASSGDSISIAAATYMENLTIHLKLRIVGSGNATTIIDGGGVNTVVTNSGSPVSLSKLTIRNGNGGGGGGVSNSGALSIIDSTITGNFAPFWGGGIYNTGSLSVMNSNISRNKVFNNCYNICPAFGGGIYNDTGSVIISNSTLSGNSAVRQCHGCSAAGGGIFNVDGSVTISNSTLAANSVMAKCTAACYGSGGAIWNNSALTASSITVSGNNAVGTTTSAGGGVYEYDGEGTAVLQNSIVANNSSGGNCSGNITTKGYNLSNDNSCNFNGPGDVQNANPLLGPLQYNGGPTKTMALGAGSPAIDAGNPSGCTDGKGNLLKTDQRGKPRPNTEDTGGCDIGAYERQSD